MQTLDQIIYVGGTFRMRGRIKNTPSNQYLDFTDAQLDFYVQSNKGVYVPELAASSAGDSPLIVLEHNGIVFNVGIPVAATSTITFPNGVYTLWVTWANGDQVPLVGGTLTSRKGVKPS